MQGTCDIVNNVVPMFVSVLVQESSICLNQQTLYWSVSDNTKLQRVKNRRDCWLAVHASKNHQPDNIINPHLLSGLFHPYQLDDPFPILGVFGVLFHFYSISNRYSCWQTVKTLRMRRLIWVCTVCLCPKNGTLGLYGLRSFLLFDRSFLFTSCRHEFF